MITKEILLEIGRKKGLTNKEHIEKNYFQDLLLFYIFKKTNKFVFKGGTALYKIYGLPRFSEDLDFSILEDISLEEAEKIIKEIAKNNNYFKIKSVKKIKDSLLIKISCTGILTRYNALRVDINFNNKLLRGFDVKNYISDYVDINPFSLRVLKIEEIIAEKIHALLSRDKARDLYDLFFLLRIANFDRKLTEEKLKIFGKKLDKKLLEKNISNLESVWTKELKAFVLSELPDFNVVKDFVLSKIQGFVKKALKEN